LIAVHLRLRIATKIDGILVRDRAPEFAFELTTAARFENGGDERLVYRRRRGAGLAMTSFSKTWLSSLGEPQ